MKYFFRIVRTALRALSRNKMRSGLTALGIVIGIFSVIAMMELGRGSSTKMKQTIASMGANTIMIFPGAAASGGASFGGGSAMTLTPKDADAIMDPSRCPSLDAVAPVVRVKTQVVYGNRNWVPMTIYGTTPAFLIIRDWDNLDQGRCFDEGEVNQEANVCILGQTLVRELFQGESPIGQTVRVQNKPLMVIGVLSKKGANMMGSDQDDILLAPWTTIKLKIAGSSAMTANQSAAAAAADTTQQVNTLNRPYPNTTGQAGLYPQPSATQAADTPQLNRITNVDQILARARSTEEITPAMQQITDLLHERHHIRADQLDDFNLRDMTEITKTQSSVTDFMGTLLLFVAMASLLVGGVGIMNIMLVSVTERTREIGLRMAVGARGRDILRQFLIEAVVLCVLGGLTGIVLGELGSWGMRRLLNWATELSLPAIIASVGVATIVGIVFGYYPAWKASRLDPIEALRYE